MIEFYVEVIDGYIEGWSEKEIPNWRLIKTDKTLIGKLSRVKVVNDVAVLDEEKQKQLENDNNNETLMEKVIKENSELKEQLDKTQEDVTNTQVALTEVFELIENLA